MQTASRAKRWDKPFGDEPPRVDLANAVLLLPLFNSIDANYFPDGLSPAEIVINDGRILELSRGDTVFSMGAYGTSVFVILMGAVSCILPAHGAGQDGQKAKQSRWPKHDFSAMRAKFRNLTRSAPVAQQELQPGNLPDDAVLLEQFGPNDIFGLVSAISRTARRCTAVASQDHTRVLELRWPGMRDLRYWSDAFRTQTSRIYSVRAVDFVLRTSAVFEGLDEPTLKAIAEHAEFETYGDALWSHRYQRQRIEGLSEIETLEQEPVIAAPGHYLDDLIIIHAGFARKTRSVDHSERNVALLTSGDAFGLEHIVESAASDTPCKLAFGLRAVGYADIVRIPTPVIDATILPAAGGRAKPLRTASKRQAVLDFALENRLMNGTRAMVINTDRCVNCDDCVRACAATHGNVARFQRRGKALRNLLVADACMHCVDPVCLIDCPTDAIHRDLKTGVVVVDEANCIGCSACASACPYNNIQMEPVLGDNAMPVTGSDGAHIQRASKCDLCIDLSTGPACVQACPHDALMRMEPVCIDDFLISLLR